MTEEEQRQAATRTGTSIGDAIDKYSSLSSLVLTVVEVYYTNTIKTHRGVNTSTYRLYVICKADPVN